MAKVNRQPDQTVLAKPTQDISDPAALGLITTAQGGDLGQAYLL